MTKTKMAKILFFTEAEGAFLAIANITLQTV